MQFFFLFIGREPTMWPANNCLQTIVCFGAMSSNCVWLQIIFCSCSFSDRSCVKMADRFASGRYSLQNKLGDRMIRQLLNSVIAEYRDLSVASRSTIQTICLSLRFREVIYPVATDKSRNFAPPRPIIVNCFPRDLTLYLPAPSFSSKLVTLSLPYMAAVWSGVCPSKSDTFTCPVHLISLLRVFMSPVLAALFIRWANWNSLMVPPRAFRCSATSWWPFTTASE